MGAKRFYGWSLLILLLTACSEAAGERERLLRRQLESDRLAHLTVDAGLLSSGVADSLLVVDAGRVDVQDRESVEGHFTEYFRGASYQAWDDVIPPRIRISSGGDLAVVHRVVQVQRTEPVLGLPSRSVSFQSAWTATYEWTSAGWRMASVTSTFLPPPDRARTVLGGARRAVGLAALPQDSVFLAEARVTGPTGPFQVTIHSAPGGEARLAFAGGPTFTVHMGGGKVDAGQGEGRPLTDPDLTFLRGHEIHLMLLDPLSRLEHVRVMGEAQYAGRGAIWLRGEDAAGSPVDLYYAAADTSPLGYRVTDHTRPGAENVTLTWTGEGTSQVADEPILFTPGAVFEQGAERFTYRFSRATWVARSSVDFGSR
ncbi:MAG: hypothetical protein HKO53_02740 [Gemmatimonadetes bacterium]|nr:hypothetical protein [Gemmatimonadota bacterium]